MPDAAPILEALTLARSTRSPGITLMSLTLVSVGPLSSSPHVAPNNAVAPLFVQIPVEDQQPADCLADCSSKTLTDTFATCRSASRSAPDDAITPIPADTADR